MPPAPPVRNESNRYVVDVWFFVSIWVEIEILVHVN